MDDIVLAELTYRELPDLLIHEMAIEGGHYIVGESIDSVSECTWERAVELYCDARARDLRNLGLTLLVDDFEIVSAERERFRNEYSLPPGYRKTLERGRIDASDVSISWGVQLRNRARGDLRKRLKSDLILRDEGYFTFCVDGTCRQVTSGTVPICNLIMARYTAEKDRRFKHALNLYDMRWECQSTGGAIVSRSLYHTLITVHNIYITLTGQIGFAVTHTVRS